ncbi:hypothetical protein [Parasitella parasitica]|uniref:RhoGAP-domain-containing protein n=1 Tax=Parasitella parasitica TaxID=35722 RepID=A0A0B7MX32_9FUNG|nr:hypothetical protein [Parasitella parasitica]
MVVNEIIVPTCQGCCELIEEGAVVAFGDSLFHVKCFICAKCGECVDNKINLLLLDDGRPGIYCTVCNKTRKADRQTKKSKASDASQSSKESLCQDQQLPQPSCQQNQARPISISPKLPTPDRSRSNSPVQKAIMEVNSSCNSVLLEDFTFSFFENDSNELNNLSNTLGANLTLSDDKYTPQYRIKRASEILQTSLRTSSLSKTSNEPSPSAQNDELIETRSRLKELEANYKVLQDASQQALNEITQLKDDLEQESAIKKQQELTIVSLMSKSNTLLSRKEVDKLAYVRIELERACKELIHYRDKIATTLDEQVSNTTVFPNYQKSLKMQIKSLIQERNLLKSQTKDLATSRDEVIHEMVLLNTKIAELATMNNDLSRRVIAKEEATLTASPAMPLSNSPPLSPSRSSDALSRIPPASAQHLRKPSNASSTVLNASSKKSFISDQTPTLFRLKKKGSTMFGKLGTVSATPKPSKLDIPSSGLLSSSSSSIFRATSKTIYNNPSYSSSLQSINYQDSSALGKSSSKSFTNTSISLSRAVHESHSFQPTFFLKPVKCGSCGDKIWSRSEYRCDGCGLSSHSRCLSKVSQQCTVANTSSSLDLGSSSSFENASSPKTSSSDIEGKTLPQQLTKSTTDCSIFGSCLSEHVKTENRTVPLIVEECIKEVEKRGLDCEGIYRKSGGAAQIRAIQLAFEKGEDINLSDEVQYNDVCAITSVLKQFFRELSNPLLTFELYDQFIQASAMDHGEEKTKAFSNVLQQLPMAHIDTLEMLLRHLVDVYKQSDVNRMSVKNLAMVFAPTLMRHSDTSKDFLDISYKNATIEYLLLHKSELFSAPSPSTS